MALGSCHAIAKPANGARPQALPSGWHVPLEALVAPPAGAPPDEVGRVYSTEFILHHILAGSTLVWRQATISAIAARANGPASDRVLRSLHRAHFQHLPGGLCLEHG